jgi:hypothetical protein
MIFAAEDIGISKAFSERLCAIDRNVTRESSPGLILFIGFHIEKKTSLQEAHLLVDKRTGGTSERSAC